jgi:hypothetical protein
MLGVEPSPLDLRPQARLQHTRLPATQTSEVATRACLGYLHLHMHTRPMRPSTALPADLHACSQRILGVVPSPLAHRPDTHITTPQLRLY